MSEAAITSIITGLVTITTLVIGFLTLWVKLRYGVAKAETIALQAESVENKIDHNTHLTVQAKEAAKKASEHTVICDNDRKEIFTAIKDHDARIRSLEAQMASLNVSVDGLGKNIDSTRHEIRGHLQTVMNTIQMTNIKTTPAATTPESKT